MKILHKATAVISKIIEVGHWVSASVLGVLFILMLLPGDVYKSMISLSPTDEIIPVKVYGLEATLVSTGGEIDVAAWRVFAIGAAILLGVGAMIFRNIYLIIKTSNGETKFSRGATPFQKDVTRMIREIGIFLLATVVLSFIFGTIGTLVVGADTVNFNIDLSTIMIGLLMLCLSHAFAEGEKMRDEVDGLL